ncbi:MAG: nitronate monooxygenase [Acidimicrobiia bacterium]
MTDSPASHPLVIQGGMGVAVSGWRLAKAVAEAGQMGVVSGTAIDAVHARTLQDGDPTGDIRRAYEHFPIPGVAERVLERWYLPEGRPPGQGYKPQPMLTAKPTRSHLELMVISNFGEVWLAKEGHDGPIGVNYLEKLQLYTPSSAYGAILAGVDAVIMGAGIPSAIPRLLRDLTALKEGSLRLDVEDNHEGREFYARFNPESIGIPETPLTCPKFYAVVSSASLGKFLARDPETRPDGLIVEMSTAGGHNAPPRGGMKLDDAGEPIYGKRDQVDLEAIAKLGLPFWLAGSYGTPDGVVAAKAAGAEGVQVGTVFAFCEESGMTSELKSTVIDEVQAGTAKVKTDPRASSSGFPFKVVSVPYTVSEDDVYQQRDRVCDLGYLRVPYLRPNGVLGYRCSAEPVDDYVRKGGKEEDTVGRKCLCNGLVSTVGFGQVRYPEQSQVVGNADKPTAILTDDGGVVEPGIVTAGNAVYDITDILGEKGTYSAAEVVAYLLSLYEAEANCDSNAVPQVDLEAQKQDANQTSPASLIGTTSQ